jgi:hypothetical protein
MFVFVGQPQWALGVGVGREAGARSESGNFRRGGRGGGGGGYNTRNVKNPRSGRQKGIAARGRRFEKLRPPRSDGGRGAGGGTPPLNRRLRRPPEPIQRI